ncbi:hypothetical protein DYB28_012467 [Aphanomyces astaci]|uniref:HTH CENPB-type domain-containing protein n=1 Tax=Aphanomyces astaci TaxID=112090 RepID=A0A9X8DWX4_APHAT|nr:hypothetical protein DYB28_012467 [Aphanomyces astaci]
MADNADTVIARRKSPGRPAFKYGRKAVPKLFKNKTVDYKHRLEAIIKVSEIGMCSFLDSYCANSSATERESTRKKVHGWVARRQHIEAMANRACTSRQKTARLRGIGTTLPQEAEEQLTRWVHGMRKDGIPVTYAMLRFMALETAIDVGLTEAEFKAGWHWIRGFKQRNNLTFRTKTRVGQDTNEDGARTLEEFAERIRGVVAEHGIERIYNADQTGVNYEYLPTKTLNAAKENTVWVKCGGKTKDRATAMLMADSTGAKHTLFLVLKTTKSTVKEVVQENLKKRQGFGKKVWREVLPLQRAHRCQIYGNPTAWWNAGISLAFLKFHFASRADRATKKVMLIWDDFSAHFTEEVVAYAESLNVVLERVPPRFTWICQSADVAWIRPLKVMLRAHWLDELKRQVRLSKATGSKLVLRGPSRSTIVSWVTGVWGDLPVATILNGFRKCQLVSGPVEEVAGDVPVLDDDTLGDLLTNMAIEDTIHPDEDIDYCDEAETSEQN